MKSAALAITLAAASMTVSSAAELAGNVPVDFRMGKATHRAGVYHVAHRAPGVVTVKTADGAAVGIQMLSVQTENWEQAKRNTLSFRRDKKGEFQLTGYCISGQGCWESRNAATAANDNGIEIAMIVGK